MEFMVAGSLQDPAARFVFMEAQGRHFLIFSVDKEAFICFYNMMDVLRRIFC